MVRIILLLSFSFTFSSIKSQYDTLKNSQRQLINKKLNFYQNTSIDGLPIDSNYFKGKITLVSFYGFNCAPCQQELSVLDEIRKKHPGENYQILLIGDASVKDLRDLRACNSRKYNKLKRKLKLDTLAFDMIADCPNNEVRAFYKSCKGSTESFKVFTFPTTFFINREGVIKEICTGYSVPRNKEFDDYFYSKLKEAER